MKFYSTASESFGEIGDFHNFLGGSGAVEQEWSSWSCFQQLQTSS
jgi:hypothetical protein